MLVLFTDFGANDVYVGQIKARLGLLAPDIPVIDLLHGVPNYAIEPGAHLLAALAHQMKAGSVIYAVVDPGVGGKREAVVMQVGTHWYVGPDNGLLSIVAAREQPIHCWRIDWRPESLSASFHGRDLFAPIAAEIARGTFPDDKLTRIVGLKENLPTQDLGQVIYVDHYGNAFTGLRANQIPENAGIEAKGIQLPRARTFSDMPIGSVFCYANSIGLMEIAMNQGHAAESLNLTIGEPVRVSL